jgi:hypothetical protein
MASDESGYPWALVAVAVIVLLVLAVVVVIGVYCLWYPACLAPTSNGALNVSSNSSVSHSFPIYPDPVLTPGDVLTTDTRIICVPGYSASVRDVSESLKEGVYLEYGIIAHPAGSMEIDHFVPLSIGGSNEKSNLWPERYNMTLGAREKDKVENYLHREVCGGRMSIEDAQERIRSDWVAVYEGVYGG